MASGIGICQGGPRAGRRGQVRCQGSVLRAVHGIFSMVVATGTPRWQPPPGALPEGVCWERHGILWYRWPVGTPHWRKIERKYYHYEDWIKNS